MKVLIVGGTGNVGAEVVKALVTRNADVRLLVRKEGAPEIKGSRLASAICSILSPWLMRWTLWTSSTC
jgi:nucleoside-diphosphate-sugar epimerase